MEDTERNREIDKKLPTFEEYTPIISDETIEDCIKKIGDLRWSKTRGVRKIEGTFGGLVGRMIKSNSIMDAYTSAIWSTFAYKRIWKTQPERDILSALTEAMYTIDTESDYFLDLQNIRDSQVCEKNETKFAGQLKKYVNSLYDLESPGAVGVLVEFARIIYHRSGFGIKYKSFDKADDHFNEIFDAIRDEYSIRVSKKSEICEVSDSTKPTSFEKFGDIQKQIQQNLDKMDTVLGNKKN